MRSEVFLFFVILPNDHGHNHGGGRVLSYRSNLFHHDDGGGFLSVSVVIFNSCDEIRSFVRRWFVHLRGFGAFLILNLCAASLLVMSWTLVIMHLAVLPAYD